ncbi:DNA methylase [Candidatus Methylobacter favarea]|uniref:DNA methylase n=1 Tax=Candidatus Methylobacter favarea TaxID=2707345 RepID=A0A8S0WHL4_9GAMM|nr:DNA methyltransferase [Candidatus Methylobacter favarea]CAA9889901.1 DNA methylase [Candidatus Methylobacter favarea]
MAYLEDKIQQVQDKALRDLLETFRVKRIKDGSAVLSRDADGSKCVQPLDKLVVVQRFGETIYPALIPMATVENGGNRPFHTLIEADNFHALQLLDYLYAGQVDCIYIDPPYNTGAKDWKYNNNYVDNNDSWRHSKWLTFMEKRLKLAKRLLKPDTGVLIVTIDEHEVHHLGMLLEQTFPNFYRQIVTIVVNPKGVTQGRFSRVEECALFCFSEKAFVAGLRDDLLTLNSLNVKNHKIPRWKGLLRSGTNARRQDREKLFFPILIDTDRHTIIGVGEYLPLDKQPDIDASINGYVVAWPIRSDGSFGNWGVGPVTLRKLISKGYVSLGGFDAKRKTWGISYLSKKLQLQIESGAIQIVEFDAVKNIVNVEYAEARERQIKTVWHRSSHDAGAYGADILKAIFGETGRFSFPKSLYAVRDSISAIVLDRPNALIVDFFAGSATTLNAVNLMNATDNGNRRCILVTNNEVSAEEAKNLQEQGLMPGDADYEKHGICQSVTWPRSKYTILGRRDDGTLLDGDYLTGRTITKNKRRTFKQIGFIDTAQLTTARKKELAGLLDGIPQSKINKDTAFFVDETCTSSVLFDDACADAYLEALDDMTHIETFYLVTANNALFERLKGAINELLGPLKVSVEEKRPLSAGFEANLAYFKLDFLDPDEVQLGRRFAALVPILWLMAGAKGACPDADDSKPFFIPERSPFAVLLDEHCFLPFKQELQTRPDISHVFLVTHSEEGFFSMRDELDTGYQVMQLFKNYLDQFKINTKQRGRS